MADQGIGLGVLPNTTVILIGEADARAATLDDKYVRTYHRTFLVQTQTGEGGHGIVGGGLLDAGAVAIGCQGIPAIFDAYRNVGPNETDPPALLSRIDARPHDNTPDIWAAACEYTTAGAHPDYQHVSPFLRKRRLRTRTERERYSPEWVIDATTGAKAKLQNSAGAFYDAVEVDRVYKVIEIEKNLERDPDFLDVYVDCVNNNAAFGKQAGQLKVFDINCPDEQFENGVRFWPTKLILHCKNITLDNPAPWRLTLLDQGFEYWDEAAGEYFDFADGNGRPRARAGLLDGSGGQLAHGGAPVYNSFIVHPELTFAPLVNLFS